jgi:dTMP kinase
MIQGKHKGFFLCLEGIDGSGKSTLSKWLEEWFTAQGITPVMTREPGGTPLAETLRSIVLTESVEPIDPVAETHIFMAARAIHLNNLIRPKLLNGELVITDRFCDSTFCYQGAGRGLDIEKLRQVHELSFGKTYPDLTIVIDGSPELFRARIAASRDEGNVNHFDTAELAFHHRSRALYKEFAEKYPERYLIVNGEEPFEQVCAQVIRHLMYIEAHLRKRPEPGSF